MANIRGPFLTSVVGSACGAVESLTRDLSFRSLNMAYDGEAERHVTTGVTPSESGDGWHQQLCDAVREPAARGSRRSGSTVESAGRALRSLMLPGSSSRR